MLNGAKSHVCEIKLPHQQTKVSAESIKYEYDEYEHDFDIPLAFTWDRRNLRTIVLLTNHPEKLDHSLIANMIILQNMETDHSLGKIFLKMASSSSCNYIL